MMMLTMIMMTIMMTMSIMIVIMSIMIVIMSIMIVIMSIMIVIMIMIMIMTTMTPPLRLNNHFACSSRSSSSCPLSPPFSASLMLQRMLQTHRSR